MLNHKNVQMVTEVSERERREREKREGEWKGEKREEREGEWKKGLLLLTKECLLYG